MDSAAAAVATQVDRLPRVDHAAADVVAGDPLDRQRLTGQRGLVQHGGGQQPAVDRDDLSGADQQPVTDDDVVDRDLDDAALDAAAGRARGPLDQHVGVTAFIFDVTREKLLEMNWFEKLYEFIMDLRAKAMALVEPVKARIANLLRGDGAGGSVRTLRLIQRFRRGVHRRAEFFRALRRVIARFKRAIQYSRDSSERADELRRTGCPGQAGHDSGVFGANANAGYAG